MLNKILNFEGVKQLNKKEQYSINGGDPSCNCKIGTHPTFCQFAKCF